MEDPVIQAIVDIFQVPIFSFKPYAEDGRTRDFRSPYTCDFHSGPDKCGHIIFMHNIPGHFEYLTTDIQNYNRNVLSKNSFAGIPGTKKMRNNIIYFSSLRR